MVGYNPKDCKASEKDWATKRIHMIESGGNHHPHLSLLWKQYWDRLSGNSTTCFDWAIVVVGFLPKKKYLNKLCNNANRRSFMVVELIRTQKSKSKGTKHNCFTACVQKGIHWSYWRYFVYFLFIFQSCPKLPMCSL